MSNRGSLLDKALHSTGGKEAFDRKFRQYEESVAFIDKNREQLLKKYDNSWLAVYNAEVVAAGKDYKHITEEIRRQGLPIKEVVIKFITSREMLMLF